MVLPSPTDLDWDPVSIAALIGITVVSMRLLRGSVTAGPPRLALDTRRSAAAQPDRRRLLASGTRVSAAERRHRRRRLLAAGSGLAALAVALLSPLATLADHYLLTAHLVQVTLVMGFAPPLLLLGLPARLPAAPRPLRLLGRALVHPACAIVLVNAVFFGWHAPVLYDAALQHPSLYAVQQLMLFLVSVAFWWAIVEPTGPGPWTMSGLLKLGYILLATIPQTFAGLLFALAQHVFYAPYAAAPRVTGLDALGDQQLAGALMAILSKLALFAAFSVVLWRVLDGEGQDSEPDDDGGGHGRGGDDDRPHPVPPDAPAWLELLRSGRTVPEPTPMLREPGGSTSPRHRPALPGGGSRR